MMWQHFAFSVVSPRLCKHQLVELVIALHQVDIVIFLCPRFEFGHWIES